MVHWVYEWGGNRGDRRSGGGGGGGSGRMTEWSDGGRDGGRDLALNRPGARAAGRTGAGDHLRRLWLVSTALRGVTTIPELLAIILQQGVSCLSARTGVVYLREPGGHLRLTHSVGLPPRLASGGL